MKLLLSALSVVVLTMQCFAEEPNTESHVEIRAIALLNHDSSKTEERVFLIGNRAHRTLEGVTNVISVFSSKPKTHFAVYGACFPEDPQFTYEEIEILKKTCRDAGVQFTFYPAG